MTVLVTGGAGFIGSHMVLALLEAGDDVLVLDNLSTGFRRAVSMDAKLIIGDVGDYELVKALLLNNRIQDIIHFAGSVSVPESTRDPMKYYLNNTCNSRALIACALETGVPHFIFSSTAAVYGECEQTLVGEDAELRPVSPYGHSKLMTEFMLRDSAEVHDFRYLALRYFNVAGADPQSRIGQLTPNASHLIKVAVEVAVGKRSHIEVFGTDYSTPDGTCLRDYIHVVDLVEAHKAALRYLRNGGQSKVLNCGYGHASSVLNVIAAVNRVAKKDILVRIGPRRSGDPAALVARADRIKEVLGWRPRYDNLHTIVRDALAWEERLVREDPLRPERTN